MKRALLAIAIVGTFVVAATPASASHYECRVDPNESIAHSLACYATDEVPNTTERVVEDQTGCPDTVDYYGDALPSVDTGTDCYTDQFIFTCQGVDQDPTPVGVTIDGESVGATVPGASAAGCVNDQPDSGSAQCVTEGDDGHTITVTVGDSNQTVTTPAVGATVCVVAE